MSRQIIAQNEQARRDEHVWRIIAGLLDVQVSERKRSAQPRQFGQILLLIGITGLLGIQLFDVFTAIVVFSQTGHLQFHSSDFELFAMLPMLLFVLGPLLYFPYRSMYACLDSLLQNASAGDSLLAPLATTQPASADLPLEDVHISPLLRWGGRSQANTNRLIAFLSFFVGATCLLVGSFIVALTVLLPSITDAALEIPALIAFVVLSIVFIGGGIALFVIGLRASRNLSEPLHDLSVTVSRGGLRWSDPAWQSRQQMWLPWREARLFAVMSYQHETSKKEWRLYLLDDGATRLTWALPLEPYAESLVAHERLTGLIVGATGLPLRDLTPGVGALGAIIRSLNPLMLMPTQAEKDLAAAQPSIPGAPIQAIRRWKYGYYAAIIASVVISLCVAAIAFLAWLLH